MKQSSLSPHRVLLPTEMAAADAMTIREGIHSGWALMRNAAGAVADAALTRVPDAAGFDMLCGPGNNGGDGYAAAVLLAARGVSVAIYATGSPRAGSDAETARSRWQGAVEPISSYKPAPGRVVIDALFGAGLDRPMTGDAADAAQRCRAAGTTVLAVDLPSGLSGASGIALGEAFRADVTVTFARRKPGHLLADGPARCGEVLVVDIGIPDRVVDATGANCFENGPALWAQALPRPGRDSHKYSRGHVLVLSGGRFTSGAARLSAAGAARAGAGAVTLGCPPDALAVNAAHVTATMLAEIRSAPDATSFCSDRKVRAAVLGPGFGADTRLREMTTALLGEASGLYGLVLDADIFTAWRDEPATLFDAIDRSPASIVMTPHEGEFSRLFPDLVQQSKLERARAAAARSGATIIYKGADTVIATPDGRAAINMNGSPWLATAGSGDVLAGIAAGLLAQGMPAWEAACAAAWLHAEAGCSFGPGLIAEDLPALLPPILRLLL